MAQTKTKSQRRGLKVGDRVRIKRYRTWIKWGDRKPQQYGFIKSIDGAYILVKPRWQRDLIELYPNEIELANRRR